ncbi:MAG: efflux RND transporter periplasmic adaptor subunit [Chromatiaceae bacterium]|nr:efflux RND transporter periplasmic adaptor subunit [Gammaproteobacteria bacterium]MCP5300969.1 efflux RND transporter periplasmic adaptor subunit [Chromatiaceae bacterium]MCP5421558.1 efflux RND transporter periplasmic adaptor subunit [Chromatiaceae bacterium]
MNSRPAIMGMLAALVFAPCAMAEDIPAVVGWAQRVELGPLVSGVVSEVHVRPGQTVKTGDPLISLDQRGFTSEVGRRAAEQRHAKVMLDEAQREDDRAAELYDRTVLSDYERNQAMIALEAARATAERARAALVGARLDLEHSVVRAPFDGVVIAVNAVAGLSVVSELQSQPLVTLADDRRLQARAEVDAEQAGRLRQDMVLSATLRGRSVQARVAYIGFEPVTSPGQEQAPRYELVTDIGRDVEPAPRVGETLMLHLD